MRKNQNSEFNADRIRLLLDLRGWTQGLLAAKADVSNGTLSNIINGKRPFTTKYAEALSMVSGLPLNFFVLREEEIEPTDLTFRKTRGTKTRKVKELTAEYSLFSSAVVTVADMCGVQERSAWIEGLSPAHNPTVDEIERIAAAVRTRLGVESSGPVRNVMRSLEKGGVIIAPMSTRVDPALDGADRLEGITWPRNPRSPLAVGYFRGSRSGDGIRFTIAHELGHAILQRNRRPSSDKLCEDEASYFASAFLFPEQDARAAIDERMTLAEFTSIKAGWGISIAAIVRRARDLGIISPERYRSMQIQINRYHWRHKEPVVVNEERPIYFKQLLGAAFGTVETATDVSASAMSVERFLGIPFEMADYWADGVKKKQDSWEYQF
jgi:transcriptional regulator with XRE-family HTH domain